MNEQSISEEDAIKQVKQWAQEGDFAKAAQGCREILEVDPGNNEVKALLQEYEQKAGPGETPMPTPENKPMQDAKAEETPTTTAPAPTMAMDPLPVPEPIKMGEPAEIKENINNSMPTQPEAQVAMESQSEPSKPIENTIEVAVPETTPPMPQQNEVDQVTTQETAETQEVNGEETIPPSIPTPEINTPEASMPIAGENIGNEPAFSLEGHESESEIKSDTETPMSTPESPTPKHGSGVLRMIAAIVSLLLIAALGYFAYTQFFAGADVPTPPDNIISDELPSPDTDILGGTDEQSPSPEATPENDRNPSLPQFSPDPDTSPTSEPDTTDILNPEATPSIGASPEVSPSSSPSPESTPGKVKVELDF